MGSKFNPNDLLGRMHKGRLQERNQQLGRQDTIGRQGMIFGYGPAVGIPAAPAATGTDAMIAAVQAAVPGATLAELWETDTNLIVDGSNNLTSLTGRNGAVMTTLGGQTCVKQADGSLRGVCKSTTLASLDPGSGLLVCMVVNKFGARSTTNNGGIATFEKTDLSRQICLLAAGTGGSGESSRSIAIDGATPNAACGHTSEATTGERTFNIYYLKPGGARAALVVNEENAAEAALGGVALGTGDFTVTVNKELAYSLAASYGNRDWVALAIFKVPASTDTQVKAAVRAFTRTWGKYALEARTKKKLVVWGDSISAGDAVGNANNWPYEFRTTRAATWDTINRSIGGYRLGQTVSGAAARGDRATNVGFDLEAKMEDQWWDVLFDSVQRTNGTHHLFFIGTNDEANETTPPMDQRLADAIDRRHAAGVPYSRFYIIDMIDRASLATKKATYWGQTATIAAARTGVTILPHIAELHPDGQNANVTYFTDTTHPTDTGDALIRDCVLTAIPA